MYKSRYWSITLVLLLGLLAACGSGTAEESAPVAAEPGVANPTTVATSAPVQETAVPTPLPTPTEIPSPEPEIEDFDLSTISTDLNFETYSYLFSITATGVNTTGEKITQSINAEIKHTTNPPASSFTMNLEGLQEDMGAPEQISVVEVDGMVYTFFTGFGCFSAPSSGDDPFGEFSDIMSPTSLLDDLDISKVKRVRPNEIINGIEVRHYTFDETLMNETAEPGREVEKGEGHLYLAEDGGYLVRMVIDMEGSGLSLFNELEGLEGTQSVRIEYTLMNVNDPITITIPAECEESSTSDYPLLEDAYEVTSFMGIVSFRSRVSMTEAISFYKDALDSLGYAYNETGSFITDSSAMLSFANEDGASISVLINAESGGVISVTLMGSE